MSSRISILLCLFWASAHSAEQTIVEKMREQLFAYLRASNPTREQTHAATTVIRQAQFIRLEYISASFELSAQDTQRRKSDVIVRRMHFPDGSFTGMAPLIEGSTVRFFIFAEFPSQLDHTYRKPIEWVEGMRVPINAGYGIKSIELVLTPSDEIVRRSTEAIAAAAREIAEALQKLRPNYPQLAQFEPRTLGLPGSFPSIYYSNRLKETGKNLFTGISSDWCEVQFGARIIATNLEQRVFTDREQFEKTYPLQGIIVRGLIGAEDKNLNHAFLDIVKRSLTGIDALEDELRVKMSRPVPKSE